MQLPLLVAAITAAVSVAGWVVNHILTSRRDNRSAQRWARLQFTERQIEELYGPLAALVAEGRQSFSDLLISLGRDYVFPPDGNLADSDLAVWLFWAEYEFLPRNADKKSLIVNKAHLIEGPTLPPSFVSFLNHCNSWAIKHLRWKEEGVAYSWRSSVNYPAEFDEAIISTFGLLKARHAALTSSDDAHR